MKDVVGTAKTPMTRKLFYMVSPNAYLGEDAPKDHTFENEGDYIKYITSFGPDRAFVFATFTLTGEKGWPGITAIMFHMKNDEMIGWNVVIDNEHEKKTHTFFTPENQAQITLGILNQLVQE